MLKFLYMKKVFFFILLLNILSCSKSNSRTEKIGIIKENKFQKFYDSDKIEHFYLDISEEKIMKLQQSKKELANDLITTDSSVFKKLTKGDLMGML